MIPTFKIEEFLATFPEFIKEDGSNSAKIAACGRRAMMHIHADTNQDIGSLSCECRDYAIFLMTAHILTLEDQNGTVEGEGGGGVALAGIPFKATIGSVQVETTKPNSFTTDDWEYWIGQTPYGREYLAFLYSHATPIYLNGPEDSVRDLL